MKTKVLLVSALLSSNILASGFMPVANISKLTGKVLINKEKAKVGDEIAEGMIVSIPKKTDSVTVKFQNGHILKLVGGEMKIEELNPKSAKIELTSGKISTEIKAFMPNESITIHAPVTPAK